MTAIQPLNMNTGDRQNEASFWTIIVFGVAVCHFWQRKCANLRLFYQQPVLPL
jgi:hypothetical protein